MASDKNQYNKARRKWTSLHDQKRFSLPPEDGAAFVACTQLSTEGFEKQGTKKMFRKENKNFCSEVYQIAKRLRLQGQGAITEVNLQKEQLIEVIQDRFFHSVILIGHGGFSSFNFEEEPPRAVIDWKEISDNTTHLKLGRFVQRNCGVMARSLNVPLGTFCMADMRTIDAAAGIQINPRGLEHPDAAYIQPIYSAPAPLTYAGIVETFRPVA